MAQDDYTDDEVAAEAGRVASTMTTAEIFSAGFKRGQSLAGLCEDPAWAYRDWLTSRMERTWRLENDPRERMFERMREVRHG